MNKVKLAIIDDDPDQVFLYQDYFADHPYLDIDYFLTRSEYEQSDISKYEIALVDHRLTDSTGLELIIHNYGRTRTSYALISTELDSIFNRINERDPRITGLIGKFTNDGFNFQGIMRWIDLQISKTHGNSKVF